MLVFPLISVLFTFEGHLYFIYIFTCQKDQKLLEWLWSHCAKNMKRNGCGSAARLMTHWQTEPVDVCFSACVAVSLGEHWSQASFYSVEPLKNHSFSPCSTVRISEGVCVRDTKCTKASHSVQLIPQPAQLSTCWAGLQVELTLTDHLMNSG